MTDTPHPDELHHPPARWYACTGFQRDLVLASATVAHMGDCPYGLALRAWLDDRYPEPINPTCVYGNLETLCEAGFIEPTPVTQRKKAYRLTDAGREALLAHARFVDGLDI